MAANHPDRATVYAALNLARLAPSIHNSQPWLWRTGDTTVHLFADSSRWLPATDTAGRDMTISCGAALHHTRVAFAALGWWPSVHRLPDPAQPEHLAALEFGRRDPSAEQIGLSSAITRRRTDRRRYSSWEIPDGLLDDLAHAVAREGARLTVVRTESGRRDVLDALIRAEVVQQSDPDYVAELASWTGRYTAPGLGIPEANIPAQEPADQPHRHFPAGTLVDTKLGSDEPDAGQLVVISTEGDGPGDWLRAGEAASAFLLGATVIGLATCPLSQPLEVPLTRALLRGRLLDGEGHPQLIVRLGWLAPTAAPLAATPRRALDDSLIHGLG